MKRTSISRKNLSKKNKMNEEIGVMERQDTLDIGNDLETIEAVADDGGRDYNLTLRQVCHYFNSSELRAHNLTEACTNPAHIPQAFMIFVQVFYALVCILGLCGNTLVIYVVLRYVSIYFMIYFKEIRKCQEEL